jgi:hypothetical protein
MTNPTDTVLTQRARHRLGEAFVDIARSRNRAPLAIRRMHNALPGYPTAPSSGPSGAGGDGPDRWVTNDVAIVDIDTVSTLTTRLQLDARALLNLLDKWAFTRHGSEHDANPHDVGCVSCNRANSFSPRRVEGGDLCRWCADKLREMNGLRAGIGLEVLDAVPLAAVQKHARGQKLTANDVERWAGLPVRFAARAVGGGR